MMETEHLEKQFQILNRFMYMVLGSSVTLLMISFGNFVIYRNTWHGFDNYTGGVWTCVEFLSILPGLYLLWNQPWKSLPFKARLNTAFGYFAAGWIALVALAFIIDSRNAPDELNFIIIGSAILIALGYIWALKRTAVPHDEIFP
jgi:hypothetical protein